MDGPNLAQQEAEKSPHDLTLIVVRRPRPTGVFGLLTGPLEPGDLALKNWEECGDLFSLAELPRVLSSSVWSVSIT